MNPVAPFLNNYSGWILPCETGAGTDAQCNGPEQHLQSEVQRLTGIKIDSAQIKHVNDKESRCCFQAEALQRNPRSKAQGLSLLQVRHRVGCRACIACAEVLVSHGLACKEARSIMQTSILLLSTRMPPGGELNDWC